MNRAEECQQLVEQLTYQVESLRKEIENLNQKLLKERSLHEFQVNQLIIQLSEKDNG